MSKGYNKRLLYHLFFQPCSPPFIRAAGISFPVIMCHLVHSCCEVGFQMWDRILSPCLSLVSHRLRRRSELTSGNGRYLSGHQKCCVGGEKKIACKLFLSLKSLLVGAGNLQTEGVGGCGGQERPKAGKRKKHQSHFQADKGKSDRTRLKQEVESFHLD